MPAGNAFAVFPVITPITRSSSFMNVACDARMNCGSWAGSMGRRAERPKAGTPILPRNTPTTTDAARNCVFISQLRSDRIYLHTMPRQGFSVGVA